MSEQRERIQSDVPIPSLSDSDMAALESGISRSKAGFASLSRPVKIKGVAWLPDDLSCTWSIEAPKDEHGLNAIDYVTIQLCSGTTSLANFVLTIDKNRNGQFVWNPQHREVPDKMTRGLGLGTFALKIAEEFIQGLRRRDPSLPNIIQGTIRQALIPRFFLANGYTFTSDEDARIYERFLSEYKNHKDSKEYTQYGKLPSFRVLKAYVDNEEKDPYLADENTIAKMEASGEIQGNGWGIFPDYEIDESGEINSEKKRSDWTLFVADSDKDENVLETVPFFVHLGMKKEL